jgi:hypothetical protein
VDFRKGRKMEMLKQTVLTEIEVPSKKQLPPHTLAELQVKYPDAYDSIMAALNVVAVKWNIHIDSVKKGYDTGSFAFACTGKEGVYEMYIFNREINAYIPIY